MDLPKRAVAETSADPGSPATPADPGSPATPADPGTAATPADPGTAATAADPGWIASGPPEAPAIVLVHGSRLTRAIWGPVTARLAGEFRIVALDLPGHGSRHETGFTLWGAAAAIAATIDEAAGGRAVVVGHSLGGYAAMELAATSPGRVRGLVVSGASQEPGGTWRPAFRALAWLLGSRFVVGLDRLNDSYFRARYSPEIAGPIVSGGYWTDGGAAGVGAITRAEFRPRLAAYPGPTLILNGELDVILRLGARSFRRAAQHGRTRVIPRATHLSPLDQPARFAAEVAAFARSLEP